jgi:hypothetical protein
MIGIVRFLSMIVLIIILIVGVVVGCRGGSRRGCIIVVVSLLVILGMMISKMGSCIFCTVLNLLFDAFILVNIFVLMANFCYNMQFVIRNCFAW